LRWQHGGSQVVVVDHGPEFASQTLDRRACRRGVELHFVGPGKPEQNAHVDGFAGKFRDECLNQHLFAALKEAGKKGRREEA